MIEESKNCEFRQGPTESASCISEGYASIFSEFLLLQKDVNSSRNRVNPPQSGRGSHVITQGHSTEFRMKYAQNIVRVFILKLLILFMSCDKVVNAQVIQSV